MAAFVLVFTTLSQDVLNTGEVLELYRVRWQVELRFKHRKSLLGLGGLPKYDEQSWRAWIQAKLLCGLLIERLMRAAKFFPLGISTRCHRVIGGSSLRHAPR